MTLTLMATTPAGGRYPGFPLNLPFSGQTRGSKPEKPRFVATLLHPG